MLCSILKLLKILNLRESISLIINFIIESQMKQFILLFGFSALLLLNFSCEKPSLEDPEAGQGGVCGAQTCQSNDATLMDKNNLPSNIQDHIAANYPEEYISVAFHYSNADLGIYAYKVTLRNSAVGRLEEERQVIYTPEGEVESPGGSYHSNWDECMLTFNFPLSVTIEDGSTVNCANNKALVDQKVVLVDYVYPIQVLKHKLDPIQVTDLDALKAVYASLDAAKK